MNALADIRKMHRSGPLWFAPLAAPDSAVRFDDDADAAKWVDAQAGQVVYLPFGPHQEGNALAEQAKRAATAKRGGWNDRRADAHHGGHDALVASLADLNGWNLSKNPFALSTLARGGFHDGREVWGRPYEFPGADHVTYFRKVGRTAAVLVEPYVTAHYDALIDWAAARDLRVYSPPNPKASFWFPGHTYFALVMRRADRPRFLRDQLTFKGGAE